VFNIDEEKERLTVKLSEQYSKNDINIEEYERILEYINKVETNKEINIIEKIIHENEAKNNDLATIQNNKEIMQKNDDTHLSMFSWRTSNIKSINGNGGKYVSLFGTNRICIDSLLMGKTVIEVNSIFGLTEIFIPENIKIINKAVPIFGGIFIQDEINKEGEEMPELHIVGTAIFGNITIKRIKKQ
jgi:hypothetical protein